MVDSGTRAALADLGTPWAGRQVAPTKISLGKSTTSGGCSGDADAWGRPGSADARGCSGSAESRGRSESGELDGN